MLSSVAYLTDGDGNNNNNNNRLFPENPFNPHNPGSLARRHNTSDVRPLVRLCVDRELKQPFTGVSKKPSHQILYSNIRERETERESEERNEIRSANDAGQRSSTATEGGSAGSRQKY